ncbi:MAG: 5-oxoprolinase subunit PxpA [Chitinophagaceae bacterium]
MQLTIDLNCDMGEGMPTDELIMPFISSANIACGYHAGDADTIKRTIGLCLEHGVAIGAHPSFNDRDNFGRTETHLSDDAIYELVSEQLHFFRTYAGEMGATIRHVKPHGALYNMAARDQNLSRAIMRAIKDADPGLALYGLSGSCMIKEAFGFGLKIVHEVFADRTYQDDGSLTPRSQPGAFIESDAAALQQVLQMIHHKTVTTRSGKIIPIQADSVCIHGDGANAVAFAKTIHDHLKAHHIDIKTAW